MCWRRFTLLYGEPTAEGPRQPGALWEAVGLQGGCAQHSMEYARGEVCPGDEDRRVVGIQETVGSLVPLRPFREIVWIGKKCGGKGQA